MIKKINRSRSKSKSGFGGGAPYTEGYGAANLWQSGCKTSSGDKFGGKLPKPGKSGKKIK